MQEFPFYYKNSSYSFVMLSRAHAYALFRISLLQTTPPDPFCHNHNIRVGLEYWRYYGTVVVGGKVPCGHTYGLGAQSIPNPSSVTHIRSVCRRVAGVDHPVLG